MQHVQDLREDLRVGRDSGAENHQERMRAVRRLRAPVPRPAEVPALDHSETKKREDVRLGLASHDYGASVGGPSRTNLSLRPVDTITSFLPVTMTPSTCGRRSMSAMPASGPRT